MFFYALLRLIPNLASILILEGASPKAVYRLLLSWLVRARKGEFPEEDICCDPQRIKKALASNDWSLEVAFVQQWDGRGPRGLLKP